MSDRLAELGKTEDDRRRARIETAIAELDAIRADEVHEHGEALERVKTLKGAASQAGKIRAKLAGNADPTGTLNVGDERRAVLNAIQHGAPSGHNFDTFDENTVAQLRERVAAVDAFEKMAAELVAAMRAQLHAQAGKLVDSLRGLVSHAEGERDARAATIGKVKAHKARRSAELAAMDGDGKGKDSLKTNEPPKKG